MVRCFDTFSIEIGKLERASAFNFTSVIESVFRYSSLEGHRKKKIGVGDQIKESKSCINGGHFHTNLS